MKKGRGDGRESGGVLVVGIAAIEMAMAMVVLYVGV
jgi:hypothetical protein